jgi:Fe-S-cluster containining protein
LNHSTNADSAVTGELCLACGLCCDGVIFADVRLQPGDDAERLRSVGLPVSNSESARRAPRFMQPCAALEGSVCRVYAERPKHCRAFECVLLRSVRAGRTKPEAALRLIRTARSRAEKVRRLLRAVGDRAESSALSVRFRRTARRLEGAELEDSTADAYAQLTLAVHDLNLLVAETFYPGSAVQLGHDAR